MADQPQPADDADSEKDTQIHSEEVKQQYVSHWDLDYLPREQIDAAVEAGEEASTAAEEASADASEADASEADTSEREQTGAEQKEQSKQD